MKPDDLDRLLKSASAARTAQAGADEPIEMPFGFDTRVVALWRANGNGNGALRGLNDFIRRVALVATAVIVVASAGAVYEIGRNRDLSEPSIANEFAIADSLIQDEGAE
jgi:hypothetical protein